jgi:renalase
LKGPISKKVLPPLWKSALPISLSVSIKEYMWSHMGQKQKIAIIGAGIAGLACARVLHDSGHDVAVFDKGRGPGGRMSTRRVTTLGEVSFDHGAQYFTARDGGFKALVETLVEAKVAAVWEGNLVRLAPDGTTFPLANEPLYVGTLGMNGVVRAMALGLHVSWGVRVETLARNGAAWSLHSEKGDDLGTFDQIVCAVPAEQVAPLLQDHTPQIAAQARAIKSLPCWAGMYVFDAPLGMPFDAIRLQNHDSLDFIAANHSKPGRADVCAYVVHAHATWSQTHLEDGAEDVANTLRKALLAYADNAPNLLFAAAHRWRYAKVEVENGPVCAYDVGARIGTCGDYLAGPRVESAWLSGHQLGKAIASA